MTLFTVTVYVLFHFGLDRDSLDGELASGVLWVTLLLAAIIGVTRLFAAEREQGGIDALLLAPVDRTSLFLAKASALFLRQDQGPEDLGRWLGLLTLYDVVFVLLSVAVFDYLLED